MNPSNPRMHCRGVIARLSAVIIAFSLTATPRLLWAGSYNQTFTFANGTTNLGDQSVVSSNNAVASVQANRFRLTANGTQGTAAAYRLRVLDPGLEISAFTMDFDLTLFETLGGSLPGDGFSINFGAIPTPSTDYGPGEEGWPVPNGLVIAFDTYDNGSEPPAIEAKANGATLRNISLDSVAPNGAFLNLFDNLSRHVTIHWDSNGLDISYGGQTVMSDIPTPGFVPSVGNYFAFSARTGGSTEDVFFDNLIVATVPASPIETGGPVLSEFVADNEDLRDDEDCNSGAWIEIYNGQNSAVDLAGWRLTDDAGNLTKWTLPSINVGAYGHVLIWADGKDRTTAPNYHTNFSLNPEGGYVALVRPDDTVSSSFTYGPQAEDIAYGRLGAAQTIGYLQTPTPGVKNSGTQAEGPPSTEDVLFSQVGGLITGPMTLQVAPPVAPEAVIRYTTTNDLPNALSPIWPAGGLNITDSTNVRARLFEPNKLPGPASTRAFILLDSTLTDYRGSGQPFSSNLPIIVFHSFGNNIDGLIGSPGLRTFRYSYSVVLDGDPANGNRASLTGPVDFQGRSGVHVRGETSAGFPQRPYSWELWDNRDGDKDAAILGMSADSDWALISNYNDKTVIRNKQPFDTMYDLNGEGSAMRERYVEVFFRQDPTGPIRYADYRGVYVLTERIKRHDDRVNIDRLEPCDNVLTGDPAVDDLAPISGGYIIRKDKDPQINPFSVGSAGGFQVYEPDPPTANQLAYISGYMNRFHTALNGPTFADPVNGYAKYIDVQSFIDVHLWVEIYKQIDGYRLSSYFYKDRGEKVVSGPLWDYNLCIGNGNDPPTGYPPSYEMPTSWYFTFNSGGAYPWYNRLFQDPEFTLKYWDRYWQLRRSMFTPANTIELIDNAVDELSDNSPDAVITNGTGSWPNSIPSVDVPVGRHNARWQRLAIRDWPNPTNHALRTRWNSPLDPATVTAATEPIQQVSEIAYAKVWMLRRFMWMDDQSMTFNSTTRNYKPPYFNQYGGHVDGGFQLQIANPNPTGAETQTVFYTTDGTDPRGGGGTGLPYVPTAVFIDHTGTCDYLVPSEANGGSTLTIADWTGLAAPSNDATWHHAAPMGLGFKPAAGGNPYGPFTPYIATSTQSEMQTINATCYLRVPFSITQSQIDTLARLKLRVRYDDAYIAYLNGTEVARKVFSSSGTPAWNSAASASHSDASAVVFEDVDLISKKNLLLAGNNMLAIHGMNSVAGNNDFLMQPRLEGDFAGILPLNNTVNLKARIFDTANNLWSPLTDANFVVNALAASAANLVISEMHYHPLDPTPAEMTAGANNANDFEFIEIMNISGGVVDLTNCRFTEGVTFNWVDAPATVQVLGPGQRMVICENIVAFNLRYAGKLAVVAGAFVGNLSNGGETIRFIDKEGADIKLFTYSDDPPWPKDADGGEYDTGMPPALISGGYSLVLRNPLSNPDHNVGTNWRSSATVHGCPGLLDYTAFAGTPTGDADGDGIPDIIEYATGAGATSGDQSNLPSVAVAEYDVNNSTDTYVTFTFMRSLNAGNISMTPQVSADLNTWQTGGVMMTYVGSHNNGDGTETVIWRSTQPTSLLPSQLFARLSVAEL